MSIATTTIDELLFRKNGLLRNLDSTNSLVLVDESVGNAADDADVITALNDATTPLESKIVIPAGNDLPVRHFRRMFVKAIGGDILLQWIPLRPVSGA